MDSKQFHRRVWGMVLVLALLLSVLGYTLYDVQVLQGEYYYRQSQYKLSETETVEASRGVITDRYGRVLVSNQVVYQVTLNTSLMGDAAQRNQIIQTLLQVAREEGVEWNDTLPISPGEPFVFLNSQPYFTRTQNEDGTQTKTLTRLGKLAVDRKWIKDPTKEPEPPAQTEQAPAREEGLLDKVIHFFTGGGQTGDSATPSPPAQEESALPTATQLLNLMCKTFNLHGEGVVDPKTAPAGQEIPALNIGDMDPKDARAVAGVLYELYLRSRGVYWTPYVFAQDVDIHFISRVKELGLKGVEIEATTVRQYNTGYAAHLLGRVALMDQAEWEYYSSLDQGYEQNDTVGKEGVEQAFESYLRGTAGTRAVERNTSGKIVSSQWLTEPEPGDNVTLTIDLGLQEAVENILSSALPNLQSQEVQGAACVVLDVNTAEVLASASYPTFSLATYSADYNDNAADPLKPLYNRALRGTYAPGSTFKMVTAVAGLEEGVITPATKIQDEGRYTYYTKDGPMCWIYRQYGRKHGLVDVSKAIEVSCNYFFYDVGRQLGIETLDAYAAKFGLGERTGIELWDEPGVMASPAYTESQGGTWYDGNTLSVAIGQESSQFTPVQLANYIATLVNGGTRNQVHLLKSVKSSDFSQVLYTYEADSVSAIDIASQNLDAVKKGMLSLTTDGSVARYFKDLPVQVGAKTGSAQVSAQTESNAVFVCFAPYDDPQIAMAIVVEHGGSGSELGAMAADILSYYFSAQQTREEILVENTLIR